MESDDSKRTGHLARLASDFRRSPIETILVVTRYIANRVPADHKTHGKHATDLDALLARISAVYTPARIDSTAADDCIRTLHTLVKSSTDKAPILSRRGRDLLHRVLSVFALSITCPANLEDIKDPANGDATAEMKIHRAIPKLARLASEVVQLCYTRPHPIFWKRVDDWFNWALAMYMGNTALVRATVDAVRNSPPRTALNALLTTPEMIKAVTENAKPERNLNDLAARTRVDIVVVRALRASLIALRAKSGLPSYGRGRNIATERTTVFTDETVTQHLAIVQNAIKTLDVMDARSRDLMGAAVKSLDPKAPELAVAKARLVAMRDAIQQAYDETRRSATDDAPTTKKPSLPLPVKQPALPEPTAAAVAMFPAAAAVASVAHRVGLSAHPAAAAAAAASAMPVKTVAWGGDFKLPVWGPPSAGAMAGAKRKVPAPTGVPASVVLKPGSQWAEFMSMTRLGPSQRHGYTGPKTNSQFQTDIDEYIYGHDACTNRTQLTRFFHEEMPALISGHVTTRDKLTSLVTRQLIDEVRTIKLGGARKSVVNGFVGGVFTPRNIQYVKEQLFQAIRDKGKQPALTDQGRAVASKFLEQCNALDRDNAAPDEPSFLWDKSKLREHGYEALCVLLESIRPAHDAMSTACSLRALAIVEAEVGVTAAMAKDVWSTADFVETRLRMCVFYDTVVDMLVLYMDQQNRTGGWNDWLTAGEQKVLREVIIAPWHLRLSSALRTQTQWGGSRDAAERLSDTPQAANVRALFSVHTHIVCQSGVSYDEYVGDLKLVSSVSNDADVATQTLAYVAGLSFSERLAHAREAVAESVCVQGVLWERVHTVNVLRLRHAVADALLPSSKQRTSVATVAHHVRLEISAAHVIVEDALKRLVPQVRGTDMFGANPGANHLKLDIVEVGIDQVRDALRASLEAHDSQQMSRASSSSNRKERTKSTNMVRGIRGLFLQGLMDAVNGLSVERRNKTRRGGGAVSNVIAVSRLVECVSMFYTTTSLLWWSKDRSKLIDPLGTWLDDAAATAKAVACETPEELTRVMLARKSLYSGLITDALNLAKTRAPLDSQLVENLADAKSPFFRCGKNNSADHAMTELSQQELTLALRGIQAVAVRSVRPPAVMVVTGLPASASATAAPAPAAAAAAASGAGVVS
jgi:hypothetical protein